MSNFKIGGGISVPKLGSASATSGISVPKVGSVSASGGIDLSKGIGGITGGIELKKDGGNVFTSGASKKSVEDKSHQAISSYFIGPQAENLKYFKDNLDVVLNQLQESRLKYFPSDGEFITNEIQSSETFKRRTEDVSRAIEATSKMLGQHSIPFWSPRYQAHMCTDLNMPAMLGYFSTMLYNPNNVAFEASPLTTLLEMEVGDQLSEMFGYDLNEKEDPSKPTPWGHVTCDGTIANLESIWSGQYIPKPQKTRVLDEFGIQSRGKDALERDFGIEKPAQYMVSNTRHYSWPKGGAIAGIGSDNMIGIDVDNGARMDMKKLEQRLEENLKNGQPVYAVVAIIGSTEEARGLSFLVHADAAWGGYFASMLPRDYIPGSTFSGNLPVDLGGADGFVPDSSLRIETQEDIWWLRHADSITVDPHKAGYIPYPAGGLCYKDGRLRHLVTWTSPYLSQGSTLNIGVYGVEGSKPGASAVSTFLSNKCIGLDQEGYGALLGEATFSCSRLSAQWAAMTDDSMSFTVVPFNMLPSELADDATPESIEAEKQWIRDNILSASNLNIVSNSNTSPGGDSALSLLRKLGSDLNINAFAINFRNADGELNNDTLEANYLMQRVVQNFSVDSPADKPSEIPLYLTSTEFSPELYGDCAKNFKKRLGLDSEDGHDLFVLRNVVMSPFPTEKDFISELTNIFKKVVKTEVDTILEVGLPEVDMELYQTLRDQYREEVFTFKTTDAVDLTQVIEGSGELVGYMHSKLTGPILPPFKARVTNALLDRPLTGPCVSSTYPTTRMPFYLYGSTDSPNPEYHIDHALLRGPNIQLSASNVSFDDSVSSYLASTTNNHAPLLLTLDTVREETMQPFPASNATLTSLPNFFFAKDRQFDVSVWRDPVDRDETDGKKILKAWEGLWAGGEAEEGLVGRGKVSLGENVWVDAEKLNWDPYRREDDPTAWKCEFEKYLKDVGQR
ncbi:pyridoxal-dependent decarboxylase domain protein [Neofusicoccum parvum]|nr:pyridoxal-dependent decarboxylase domain protein [Neofusicoccum parvum]